MPRQRMGLPKWLKMQIDSCKYNGVKWVSREKLIFSIPWKHASSNKWTLQNDAALFKDWAIHKGKYNEGQPPCPKRWKATFRCALNASRTINEYNDGEFDEDGCKLYQFSKDDKSEKSYENLTSHEEFGDRDPADLMDKEICKCVTCKLKVDGCEKNELKKCLKTKVNVENRSIEKNGLELPETIASSAPSFYEILSSLKKDEDSKIPAYHTAPYFNSYANSNSLNSTQNHFNDTDYECQSYLSYMQVSHHWQTNPVKQEGTASLRVCGNNDNKNDFENSSSTSRSSVHMNSSEIYPTNQQRDADHSERTSYQSLNQVSYASSVASSSGDELRIAEEDLNAELSDSLSTEEGYTETRNVFTDLQPWQDPQMNPSFVKQLIDIDPFICDTNGFTYTHYPVNMKQSLYHNLLMSEGCAI